jgi:hypothetical protein
MDTEYLKTRTRACIECFELAEEKPLVPRDKKGKTIYNLASEVARRHAPEDLTKQLAADLCHKLETKYPRLSDNVFTHHRKNRH